MNDQELQELTTKYMTRVAFVYEYKISYGLLADRVRRGEVALHFIDNKIQINVAEALTACRNKRSTHPEKQLVKDLFTAA